MRVKVEIRGHAHYALEHGHRPRGRGGWLFSPENPYTRNSRYLEDLSPMFSGTFTEASQAARAWAAERGASVIWVAP
jgi:hypothetical protein